MERVVLFGGGGHCKVVIDAIRKANIYTIEGVVDPGLDIGAKVSSVKVIGDDTLISKLKETGIKYGFIAAGSIGDQSIRRNIFKNIIDHFSLITVVHPSAVIAEDVEIGAGTFIAAGAIINSGSSIGENVIINTKASVDHDCQIGNFVHIAPGATLCGSIRIGDDSHIGVGANIIQQINIGKNCLVSSGQTIKRNVGDNQRVSGEKVQENYINEA